MRSDRTDDLRRLDRLSRGGDQEAAWLLRRHAVRAGDERLEALACAVLGDWPALAAVLARGEPHRYWRLLRPHLEVRLSADTSRALLLLARAHQAAMAFPTEVATMLQVMLESALLAHYDEPGHVFRGLPLGTVVRERILCLAVRDDVRETVTVGLTDGTLDLALSPWGEHLADGVGHADMAGLVAWARERSSDRVSLARVR